MDNPILIGIEVLILLFAARCFWNIGLSRHHIWSAFKEVSFIYFFSNLPIIILLIFEQSSSEQTSLFSSFVELLNDGDLFIYTSALIAPVFWLLIAYSRDNYRPVNGLLMIVAVLLVIFSSIFFKNTSIENSIPTNTLNDGYLALYIYSITIWICSVIYKTFLDSFEPEDDENKILVKLEARR